MKQQPRIIEGPPLALYRALALWQPQIGDVVMWSGWFNTWYGIVASATIADAINVIFEGLPTLLVTMTPSEQSKNMHSIGVDKIRSAKPGVFAILQHDTGHNANVWYV